MRALDGALLRGAEEMPSDPRAVFAGSLSILETLASETPVLVAVDDVQWLDPPSARALQFAARRLADAPVGLLVSLLLPGHDALDLVSEECYSIAVVNIRKVDIDRISFNTEAAPVEVAGCACIQ